MTTMRFIKNKYFYIVFTAEIKSFICVNSHNVRVFFVPVIPIMMFEQKKHKT